MRLLELGAGIRTKGFRLCIYCVEHMLFDAFGASEALSKSARDLGMGIKSAYKYVLTNALSAGKRIGRRFTPGEFLCFLAEYAAERAIKSFRLFVFPLCCRSLEQVLFRLVKRLD